MGSDGFIPQALSNMVWACAHLRNGTRGCSGPTSGGGPPTTVAKDSRPDWTPSPQFLKAVASAATTCMPDFQSQVSRGARGGPARRGVVTGLQAARRAPALTAALLTPCAATVAGQPAVGLLQAGCVPRGAVQSSCC